MENVSGDYGLRTLQANFRNETAPNSYPKILKDFQAVQESYARRHKVLDAFIAIMAANPDKDGRDCACGERAKRELEKVSQLEKKLQALREESLTSEGLGYVPDERAAASRASLRIIQNKERLERAQIITAADIRPYHPAPSRTDQEIEDEAIRAGMVGYRRLPHGPYRPL